MSIVGIWSDKNNLKHALLGTASMNKPSTADGFGGFTSTATVVHNLGYRPVVRVYYDPNGNGTIYPSIGQDIATTGSDSLSPLLNVAPFMLYVSDVGTTTITLMAYDFSSNSGTFDVYYRIYIDPTL